MNKAPGMKLVALAITVFLAFAPSPRADDAPRQGGTLSYVLEDPDTFDCHASPSILTLLAVAPHYSTLLRFSAANYPMIEGDLAASWTVSEDGLVYTFALRPGVLFHDGSALTSADIKATYDRLAHPSPGVVSARQSAFVDIAAIETPDKLTVVFRLSSPNTGLLNVFANPFNCVYSAAALAADPKFPATHILGTGPFVFVEYAKGVQWTGRRFDKYFRTGQPYLDSIKGVFVSGTAAVNTLAAGQVEANFRFITPPDRDRIKASRGDKTAFPAAETATTQALATINTSRKWLDDVRVRRALALAIDHPGGSPAMARITTLKGYGGLLRPGSSYATQAAELATLPGLGADIVAARAEARKLLAEAGASDIRLKLLNRNVAGPYAPLGIFLIDQWRRIGVTVENNMVESGAYFAALRSGDFDIAFDFNGTATDDPTEVLAKFVPGAPGNYGRAADPQLLALFEQQKRTLNDGERHRLVRAFEDRVIQQAYSLPLYWGFNIQPIPSDLRGWTSTPSNYVGLDLGGVWRAP